MIALWQAGESSIPSTYLMILAAALFSLGAVGFLIRKNLIIVFMSIELMLNAANLTFLTVARDRSFDPQGQVYAIFVITIAAVEAAVGLALLIALFRHKASLDVDAAAEMRG